MITALTVILSILFTIGFTFTVLDKLLDIRDREAIRQRIEKFWFRIADLELVEQFKVAISSRYIQMRELQIYFLGAFVLIALMLMLIGTVRGFIATNDQIRSTLNQLEGIDFQVRYAMAFPIDAPLTSDDDDDVDESKPVKPFLDRDGQCISKDGIMPLQPIYRLSRIKAAIAEFLDSHEKDQLKFRLLMASFNLLGSAFVAIPLFIGLWLSLNFTLWLLSRITQSNLSIIIIVSLDLFLAVTLPAVLSGTLLAVLVFAIIQAIGAVPDFAFFDQPTWTTMLISSASVVIAPSLGLPVIAALYGLLFPWPFAVVLYANALYQFVASNLHTLVVDLFRVLHFDFAIDLIPTLINYAIIIDLAFSLFYLLPSFGIVLVRRSPITRKLFLNCVQRIAEHPQGPLVALARASTSFARFALSLFSKPN